MIVDPHRWQGSAADDDLPDTINLGDLSAAGSKTARSHIRLFSDNVGGQRQHQDRSVGGVRLPVAWIVRQVRWQLCARGVDRSLTSRAAASMFRSRSNCSTICVEPRLLVDVISVMPAIRPNCRSSGVATDDAIVSGLAPGRPADT